jgi:hypothetical protein
MASITTWHKIIPLSRSSDLETALAAEVRDPLWLLSRQRQVGEMRGEDTGSPAFVRLAYKATAINDVVLTARENAAVTVPFDATKPFEAQILVEPHAPDLATRAELGLSFFQILDEAFLASAGELKRAFLQVPELVLALPPDDPEAFDPTDAASSAFVSMLAGNAPDGVVAYQKAKAGVIPDPVATLLGSDSQRLLSAYSAFTTWVEATFGAIGTDDPQGWNPQRLDYDVKLRFGEANAVTVAVHPNENGSVDWSSFDVEASGADPFPATLAARVAREIPTHVRFPGMPAPRFWDFESGDLPWPDLDVARTELLRLLVLDFAMLYGVDWFVVPLELEVGKAVQLDSVVVHDVFGGRTVIERVEEARKKIPPDRFTLYGATAPGGDVGNFMLLPPLAGSALQYGPVLEQVRFARDETANMAWAIEAVTTSRIGERRRGLERDAALDAEATPPPATPPRDVPLRYSVETKVPAHWIPLLVPDDGAPSTELEKGATLRDLDGTPSAVPALGKVLRPAGVTSYRIFDEEVPKGGARVERLVYGARSRDGRSHLWVARRKRPGTGETESGLRFDAALPIEK